MFPECNHPEILQEIEMENYMIFNESLVYVYKELMETEEAYLKKQGFDDLTAREVYLMHEVERIGRSTMTEIANARHVAPGTITVAVNSLVKKGYLRRKKNESDKRIVHLFLSEKGKKVIELHNRFHNYFVNTIFEKIPELDRDLMSVSALRMINILKVFEDEMIESYGSEPSAD